MYVGIAGPAGVRSVHLDLDGDRIAIRGRAVRRVLEELIRDLA
ncbi:MAG: hypothetical protein ACTHJH_08030 [Marmoricola sp.]